MKQSKRQKKKELRARIYRPVDPGEKEARRRYALQSFLTIVFILLIIVGTVFFIVVKNAAGNNTPTEETTESVTEDTSVITFVIDPANGDESEGQRTLETAQAVKRNLQNSGYRVIITREENPSCAEIAGKERAEYADSLGGDAVICINYSGTVGGYYSLISDTTKSSGRIAKCFSLSANTESDDELLKNLKTAAVRLNFSPDTENEEAEKIVVDGLNAYAEYAKQNGIV